MKVLLTGGTGFLGKNVARRLAAAGHSLRILARGQSNLEGLPAGVEVARGDVTDAESLQRAAEGCAAVFHMAALVKNWVPDAERFERVNVGGFHNALAAAKAAGARLFYTSSFIAIGPAGPEPADEGHLHRGDHRNHYERTKALADAAARAAAAAGAEIVMLYPGVVYGPGDITDGNIVVQMVRDHLKGRFPGVIGDGERLWSYSYVEDVADGHVRALEKGRRGERYFLCGENVAMNDFFRTLERVSGARPPRLHIPYAAASGLGFALWAWAELTGHPPLFTHNEVGVFRHDWAYSSKKAQAELGYAPRSLEDGLRATVDWMRAQGVA